MPATFRPPIKMSLGHLISGFRPVCNSIARRSAVAAATVNCVASCGRNSGRSSTENHKPFRAGEIHLRPSRPRPFVCDSAKTTTPSLTPSRASFSITSLVEVVSWNTRMSRPMTRVLPRRESKSSACNTSGALTSR